MASCAPFTVTVTGDPGSLFEKALRVISENGGTVSGDASGGRFSISVPVMGRVAGHYAVSGKNITIEVTERPFMIACSLIEKAVRDQLRGR